ncbi:DGQHR domain-containing protein [Mycolicibacterium phlei]|uniref:DGQHR domain-containing protein n=1 Tax=Mycolicibacterium phlei TaxID=1771 RepID=UPI00058CD9F7|nr:DGQHR domain-containing protein [Mycolicibacterium phlei]
MAITRPAIRGRMGSTTFYEITMTARELTHSVRPARETDAWASASIDERIQRDVNRSRVMSTIVPYLAQHPDRFFGSFIVLVPRGSVEFEPLTELVNNLPAAYRNSSENIGYLTIGKGELIALDGQHRLLAFREVTQGGPHLGPLWSEVGDDEVCVLLIEEETPQKTRRIFNKVNRHAKPTGRSDNIITSEDDGYALVTRRLLDTDLDAPFATRTIDGQQYEPVNWTSNTLSQKTWRLTTISALYESVQDILTYEGYKKFSEKESPVAPDEETLQTAYDKVAYWWETILSMDAYKAALADPASIPNVRFDADSHHTLLMRPVGQIALVKGIVYALMAGNGELKLEEAVRRVNMLDFSCPPSSMWRDTIVRADGRMVARKEAYDLAARLIAYMIASEFFSEEAKQRLWEDWNKMRGKDPHAELDELEEHEQPEDLPAPLEV